MATEWSKLHMRTIRATTPPLSGEYGQTEEDVKVEVGNIDIDMVDAASRQHVYGELPRLPC